MTQQEIIAQIRDVKDFPVKGIVFKDLTTVFDKPECLRWMRDEIVNLYRAYGITKVVGIESRGFILAPAVAMELGAGFVPVRKPGKLPAETIEVSYAKEYGTDTIQMHKDALNENDVVLLHDDLLATGGSMAAALELVRKFGVKKVYINFIVELEFLEGRKVLGNDVEVSSLLSC
ncbi:MAG: adenine phosphoribosyltransferase [Paludibacteraceae bacterium]|nr:adenine phosphoribosyltransferase [Paludibacteraceae bacterium]MBQ5625706.1 adenine phosphoribosyltransferase [Paludibacteraceae bacterium]